MRLSYGEFHAWAMDQDLIDSRELRRDGITRAYLKLDVQFGLICRLARGLYHPRTRPPDWDTLIDATFRLYPRGVLCLYSALMKQDLYWGPQDEVWIAIDRKARLKDHGQLPIRVLRTPSELMHEDLNPVRVCGHWLQAFNPIRCVLDFFKHRNALGIDQAVLALGTVMQFQPNAERDLLARAPALRVERILRSQLALWKRDDLEDGSTTKPPRGRPPKSRWRSPDEAFRLLLGSAATPDRAPGRDRRSGPGRPRSRMKAG